MRVVGARLSYGRLALFDGLDLEAPAGRWTCLLGPSGVGKTSLLRLVAGLAAGAEAREAGGGDGMPLAGRIAYMAQQDLLYPWLTALENVRLGRRLRGEAGGGAEARALLARLGLEGREGALPAQLSGGQRQRVALARTLMEDRPVVLMDEPFSALDAVTRFRLQAEAARLLEGRTVLMVTHDPMEALRLGHEIYVMAGLPARLEGPLRPEGAPPRGIESPAVLGAHAELLARLSAADEAVAAALAKASGR